jgi:hypothetical protein
MKIVGRTTKGHMMKYRNGTRTFIVDMQTKDDRGYIKVQDEDNKGFFFLPLYVIDDMEYIFSWDRYEADMENDLRIKDRIRVTIGTEIERLKQSKTISRNLVKSVNDLENYMLKLYGRK